MSRQPFEAEMRAAMRKHTKDRMHLQKVRFLNFNFFNLKEKMYFTHSPCNFKISTFYIVEENKQLMYEPKRTRKSSEEGRFIIHCLTCLAPCSDSELRTRG